VPAARRRIPARSVPPILPPCPVLPEQAPDTRHADAAALSQYMPGGSRPEGGHRLGHTRLAQPIPLTRHTRGLGAGSDQTLTAHPCPVLPVAAHAAVASNQVVKDGWPVGADPQLLFHRSRSTTPSARRPSILRPLTAVGVTTKPAEAGLCVTSPQHIAQTCSAVAQHVSNPATRGNADVTRTVSQQTTRRPLRSPR
jgi:hypothetical protein